MAYPKMKFKTEIAIEGRWPCRSPCVYCGKVVKARDGYVAAQPGNSDNIIFHSRCLYTLAATTFEHTAVRFEEIKAQIIKEGLECRK